MSSKSKSKKASLVKVNREKFYKPNELTFFLDLPNKKDYEETIKFLRLKVNNYDQETANVIVTKNVPKETKEVPRELRQDKLVMSEERFNKYIEKFYVKNREITEFLKTKQNVFYSRLLVPSGCKAEFDEKDWYVSRFFAFSEKENTLYRLIYE